MRFIHCADLHLDSPLHGLSRYEGAPAAEMREATRRAFVNVIDLTLEREADFLLIAGDVFDGDWQDFNTGLFFADQLRRLADANISVFIVRGNHDALSKISKSIALPRNTQVFKTSKATTLIDERLGIAIHGQSFASAAVSDDLAAGYPAVHKDLFNIGLLHTALAGREGHEPYAPTTAERLSDKGYQYWALGHVHSREIVSQNPWIVFPGNTQGRHARELGPKGCTIVEASPDDGVSSVEFLETDVARWLHLPIDLTDMANEDDLQEAVQQTVRAAVTKASDRLLALRISVSGRTALHARIMSDGELFRANARSWINEASNGTAWLEKIAIRVSAPLDLVALAGRDDPIGWLLRKLDALAADPAELTRLAEMALSDLEGKLPMELREGDPLLRASSQELRVEALAAARERLLAAISDGAES
jgi:DNA repair protein SbcD/Mre11